MRYPLWGTLSGLRIKVSNCCVSPEMQRVTHVVGTPGDPQLFSYIERLALKGWVS